MAIVYFAIKKGEVIHHTDIKEMENLGLKSIKEMPASEFLGYGNLVRVKDGALFFGKTVKEKDDDVARMRIIEIDTALAAINQKQIRPSAEIAHAIGNGIQPPAEAIEKINELENGAAVLRLERTGLVELIDIPY
jgi:hypothetical protein